MLVNAKFLKEARRRLRRMSRHRLSISGTWPARTSTAPLQMRAAAYFASILSLALSSKLIVTASKVQDVCRFLAPVNRFRKGSEGWEARGRSRGRILRLPPRPIDSGADGIFPTMRGIPLFLLPFFATRKRRDRNDGRVASERTGERTQRINTRAR